MKKTIQNVVLGGLSSLALVAGSAFADEKEKAPKGGVLKKELSGIETQVREQLKGSGLSEDMIKQVLKSVEGSGAAKKSNAKVIARTMVIGPDGKLLSESAGKDGQKAPCEKGGVEGIAGLEKLLSEIEDDDIKKLLEKNKDEIVSGKVVMIDEEGNRIEQNLTEGQSLDKMLKEALGGIDQDIRADVTGQNVKVLAGKVDQLQAEMAAQRLLLEKILKKLD